MVLVEPFLTHPLRSQIWALVYGFDIFSIIFRHVMLLPNRLTVRQTLPNGLTRLDRCVHYDCTEGHPDHLCGHNDSSADHPDHPNDHSEPLESIRI